MSIISANYCVFVKLISYDVANDKINLASRLNEFICRFSWATKPHPEKLTNFIDHMSSALVGRTPNQGIAVQGTVVYEQLARIVT